MHSHAVPLYFTPCTPGAGWPRYQSRFVYLCIVHHKELDSVCMSFCLQAHRGQKATLALQVPQVLQVPQDLPAPQVLQVKPGSLLKPGCDADIFFVPTHNVAMENEW